MAQHTCFPLPDAQLLFLRAYIVLFPCSKFSLAIWRTKTIYDDSACRQNFIKNLSILLLYHVPLLQDILEIFKYNSYLTTDTI